MRILVILNGSTSGYSGGDLHTAAVANKWAESNDVDLYLPKGSSSEIASLIESNVNVIGRTQGGRVVGHKQLMFRYLGRVAKAIPLIFRSRDRWDVIISSSHYPFDLIPALFRRKSSTELVTYWHHHVEQSANRSKWIHLLVTTSERWSIEALKRNHAFVLTSNSATREYLLSSGLLSSQVVLTRNGVSISSNQAGGPAATATIPFAMPSERSVLFCGRLSRLKGSEDLALLAPKIVEISDDVKLIIIGRNGDDGVEVRRKLQSEVTKGKVVFTGFIGEEDKSRRFINAHVVIVPSYEEGWSLTIGDGLAARCWVVAYDLPAVREAFPIGPRYVPVGDWQRMLLEIRKCLQAERPGQVFAGTSWKQVAEGDMTAISQHLAVRRNVGSKRKKFN